MLSQVSKKQAIKSNPKVQKIVLFGSRAKDTAKNGSDIDVAIIGADISYTRDSDKYDSGNSIIKIFDDKIEFFNHGKLYDDITIEKLNSNNYSSRARNRAIARAFKEAGIIERYGSGIKRIKEDCKLHGVIEPKFEEFVHGFRVTVYKEKLSKEDVRVNVGVLEYIKVNQLIKANALSANFPDVTQRTIEQWLKQLKDENSITKPISQYGYEKLMGEQYSKLYNEFYGVETFCLRYFNVYGPRQSSTSDYSGVISIFEKKFQNDEVPNIYGDGEQYRDFVYVKANIKAMSASNISGEVFCVGTAQKTSINNLVKYKI